MTRSTFGILGLLLALFVVACGSDDSTTSQGSPDASALGDATGGDDGATSGDGGADSGPVNHTIGGTVMGLRGTGLVLQNNNADDLAIRADGSFKFVTPVAKGNAFAVTVKTQPTGPVQMCTVTGGTGTVGNADVTSVIVDCSTSKFAVGGQVSGLAGGSVVLQNNGGDDLTVSANGTFAFATALASGASYAVTVKTQPSTPTQTCSVSMGAGTVTNAAITSVRVVCSTNSYKVGGTVSGLSGTGFVLQNNGGDNLTVSANGTFTFATSVASGAAYAVTVLTQPSGPSQTCTVASGTGTVGGADVTNVAVTCTTNRYTIGGTVTGLGTGDSLVLQDNGGDNLTVNANGTFAFATSVASGATYAVTVSSQSGAIAQTCTVSGGTGTVVSGNVTSVTVNCATNTYTIGGTISGLAGTVVLQDNGGDDLTLTMNGTFAFATPVASGATYAVTVKTQPGQPAQTCVIASGTGTVGAANVTSVMVTCTTNRYTIGGTVSGLAANESVVLQDNGGDNLTVGANGAFTFATQVLSGTAYNVTVLTNPASPIAQTCTVSSGAGTVGAANVTNVNVTCTTNTYNVGGTVTGLVGSGLVLQNGADMLPITQNGTFNFPTKVASGGTYSATTAINPTAPSQTCVVTNGSGAVTNGDITSITVTCTTNRYTVGGTVTGLAAGDALVLQDNGGDNLSVNANGQFTFATSVASGQPYNVTILSASGAIAQTCMVSAGSGTVGGGNVTTVTINCATNRYTIGGTVSGLTGSGLVLQDNGGDNLTIMGNGAFAFATSIASGATYNVTKLTDPTNPWQTCTVTNGSGTVGGANVTNITVACTTNTYTVGGTVSGLAAGDSITLQNNGANNLTVSANGSFTFTTPIPSGGTYTVTTSSPSSPIAQTCTIANASGSVTNASVTNVTVTCVTNRYTIGGTVTGLTGTGLVLQDNGGDNLTINANGTFTFATSIASGSTYNVTVATQPSSGQTCAVANGNGTVGSTNVTNVTVHCAGTAVFNFTGAQQSWIVPGGVTTVTVDLRGGAGGTAYYVSTIGAGGLGGRTQGTIAVAPGDTLYVYVGSVGGAATSGVGGAAGFNGGAMAGNDTPRGDNQAGGGGGGASDIRKNATALAARIFVAGGGGGAAACGGAGYGGAVGGGLVGGTAPTSCGTPTAYATGGTQTAGGTGGSYSGYCTAGNGALGIGAAGCTPSGGGGGGGGYFGGGGGAWMGGGGGSGYADPTATGVAYTQGVQSGNGQVTIVW